MFKQVLHTLITDIVLGFLVQDEEEVPLQSGKDSKEEEPTDETGRETQDQSERSAGEDKNKNSAGTEEADGKTDAKVRSIISTGHSI